MKARSRGREGLCHNVCGQLASYEWRCIQTSRGAHACRTDKSRTCCCLPLYLFAPMTSFCPSIAPCFLAAPMTRSLPRSPRFSHGSPPVRPRFAQTTCLLVLEIIREEMNSWRPGSTLVGLAWPSPTTRTPCPRNTHFRPASQHRAGSATQDRRKRGNRLS